MWKQISLAVLLAAGLLACQTKERYQSFTPGQVWLDNNNVHINAHGGGILYDNGRYYWFGEHKTEGEGGNVANVGDIATPQLISTTGKTKVSLWP